MKKTANIKPFKNLAETLWDIADKEAKPLEAAIFNTMRILKVINPGDCYLENYIGMKAKYGKDFYDIYQLMWTIGLHLAPKRILEIGTRTGISLCQLLSAHSDRKSIEKVVCVDPFDQWTSPNLVRANLRYLNLVDESIKAMIHPIKSDQFYKTVGAETFDYILVDGDHTKEVAREDLENASKLIESCGVILFDDISTAPGECALIDMWEDFEKCHKEEFWFHKNMNGKGVAFAIKR
jgi:hypothetical protein